MKEAKHSWMYTDTGTHTCSGLSYLIVMWNASGDEILIREEE